MLIDEGTITQEDGRWVHTADLSSVSVPPTIHALLAARIDRLKPEERTALECAAVAGKVFWRGAVAALAPPEQTRTLDASLLALVRKDLIRQDPSTFAGEDAFRFRHLLVRDAAYNGIAKRVRADLHERYARWLSETTGDKAYEYEEIIAYHYEEAFRNLVEVGIQDERVESLGLEAGTRLAAVGDRAAGRGDSPATITLYRRAVAAYPRTEPARLRIMCDLARLLLRQGNYDEASTAVAEAAAIAAETGDEAALWDARMADTDLEVYRATPGASPRSAEVARSAIEVFERLNDDAGLSRAWELLGTTYWIAQQAADSTEAAERSLMYANRIGSRGNPHALNNMVAGALIFGPTPWPRAVARMEQLMSERPTRVMESRYDAIAGLAAAAVGRFEEGRSLYANSQLILRDLGLPLMSAAWTQSGAIIERYAGDYEASARILRAGADAMEAIGERSFRSTNLAFLAASLAYVGNYKDAERFALEARETGEIDDIATQVGSLTALSFVAASKGDASHAEALTREAISLVEPTDFIEQRADAHLAAADVFRIIGLPDDAREALAKAEALYEAKATPVMVERVRAMKAELQT